MRKASVDDVVNGFKTAITVLVVMMVVALFDHIDGYLKVVFWVAPIFTVVLLFATANETMKRPSMRKENTALLGVLSIVLSLVLWAMMYLRLEALRSAS